MTRVLSWNIQCGRGVDNRIDLERIVGVIREMADFDVICLQEVCRFDDTLIGDVSDQDQVEALARLFGEHEAYFGAAIDRLNVSGKQRRQFGNMILSRLPVLQVFNHQLPQPAPESPCKHMPRQALEVVVAAYDGPLRITTTHLEYHSEAQRMAQAAMLSEVQADVVANANYADHAPVDGPYAAIPRPVSAILCGDFNTSPYDTVYRSIDFGGGSADGYMDAWPIAHGKALHEPTCGLFDHQQWPEGPHCRDFFFVSGELTRRQVDVSVQSDTDASDHQPVMLTAL